VKQGTDSLLDANISLRYIINNKGYTKERLLGALGEAVWKGGEFQWRRIVNRLRLALRVRRRKFCVMGVQVVRQKLLRVVRYRKKRQRKLNNHVIGE